MGLRGVGETCPPPHKQPSLLSMNVACFQASRAIFGHRIPECQVTGEERWLLRGWVTSRGHRVCP